MARTKEVYLSRAVNGHDTYHAPLTREVCPHCEGEGKCLPGGLHGAVWTANDLQEDPEFFDNMVRGRYDRTCPQCKGLRVIDVIDTLLFAASAPEEFAAWQKQVESDRASDRERECEARAEGGYEWLTSDASMSPRSAGPSASVGRCEGFALTEADTPMGDGDVTTGWVLRCTRPNHPTGKAAWCAQAIETKLRQGFRRKLRER